MWMMVLFDLPVTTKQGMHEANILRKTLKNNGFLMAQYSVYYKMIGGKEYVPRIEKIIEKSLPQAGLVDIMYITDKQFGEIKHYAGKKNSKKSKKPEQYRLFE